MPEILCRKEFERLSGNGTFCWGIGNSLGNTFALARNSVPGGNLDILFTHMRGRANARDIEPSELLLWCSYQDEQGEDHKLEKHMIVSSRGRTLSGREKTRHYALLCKSDQDITQVRGNIELDANRVRNLARLTRVAASQVTAVVEYSDEEIEEPENPYKVAFRAKSYGAGFVKLCNPVKVQGEIKRLYRQLNEANNLNEWKKIMCRLKAECDRALFRPTN